MKQFTIIDFEAANNQNITTVNLRKLIKNRRPHQRLLIYIISILSLKPDITGFYYQSSPHTLSDDTETYWSAKQIHSRYDSLEFIVGRDNEFYLINNNDFKIVKRV